MAEKVPGTVQGEGDYDAARRYRKRTDEFIKSGKVEPAAKKAAPHSEQEAKEMEAAEKEGLSHAKGQKKNKDAPR